jgi:hypothetical protein
VHGHLGALESHSGLPLCPHIAPWPTLLLPPARPVDELAARHSPWPRCSTHNRAHLSSVHSHQTRPHRIEVDVVHERTIVINPSRPRSKWPCNGLRKVGTTADAGNYAAWYKCSAATSFPPPGYLRAFPPPDDNGCSSSNRHALAIRSLDKPDRGPQKLRPIRIIVENCLAAFAPAYHMVTRSSQAT